MAHLVSEESLTDAWLGALGWLLGQPGGKGVNLNVAFPGRAQADPAICSALDAFMEDHELRFYGEQLSVGTVANTIFPSALYRPHLGEGAAARLYESYELSMRMHRRRKRDKETYFNRLVAYPAEDGPWNQLAYFVERLKGQRQARAPKSSAYELGVSHPTDAELRVQVPFKDKKMSGFPCLSHVSLTLVDDHVHMSAIYRNQTFITRAYGNYLGLSRLLDFIATETGAEAGEVEVIATHADAELSIGKRAVSELLEQCRETVGSAEVAVSERAG